MAIGDFMKEFVRVTAKDVKLPWSGGANGKYFRCYFCGGRFTVGSEFRMIWTNPIPDIPGGNPLTCRKCFVDHGGVEGLRSLWKKRHEEAEKYFWWLRRE